MKSESEESFVKQLKANQNIVHKICRLYTSDQDSHNDLFQEITIQLWKAFPKFRGESKFTTWAYRVGLNTAITLYRKKKRSIETTPFDTECSTCLRSSAKEFSTARHRRSSRLVRHVTSCSPVRRGSPCRTDTADNNWRY